MAVLESDQLETESIGFALVLAIEAQSGEVASDLDRRGCRVTETENGEEHTDADLSAEAAEMVAMAEMSELVGEYKGHLVLALDRDALMI